MVILITGKSSMGSALREKFKEEGHKAIMAENAEQIMPLLAAEGKLDMLLIGIKDHSGRGVDGILSEPDWKEAEAVYEADVVESLLAVQKAFLYLEQGQRKRICYLNAASGSINVSMESGSYGVCMSACALNMQANLLYNRMRKLGYTFRIFAVEEEADIGEQVSAAYWYFTENRSVDMENEKHTDENRLVMRNKDGREIPF